MREMKTPTQPKFLVAFALFLTTVRGASAPVGRAIVTIDSSFSTDSPYVAECDDVVTISPGHEVRFTSVNYPKAYPSFSSCSAIFKPTADAYLEVTCPTVHMGTETVFSYDDGDTTIRRKCKWYFIFPVCSNQPIETREVMSDQVTIGMRNTWIWKGVGFNCTIKSYSSCECGRSLSNRIVNGNEADRYEYPWMVSLMLWNETASFCGGTIICSNYILTAAHCVNGTNPSILSVVVGNHNQSDAATVTRVAVSEVISHPLFSDTEYDYDVALLKLMEPLSISGSSKLRAVCLSDPGIDYTGKMAVAIGWGRTSFGGSVPNVLLEADLPVVDHDTCNASYPIVVTQRVICAGGAGKHVCNGDSGGPLMYKDPSEGYYTQIGITSFAIFCGGWGHAGGFADVSVLRSWIDSNANCEYCAVPV